MTYIGTLEASSPVYLSHTKIMYEYMEVFFLRDYKPYEEKLQLSTRLQAILLKKQTPKDTGQEN